MAALRKPPAQPQPCPCAARTAELEATISALASALITLRPAAAGHSIEQSLTGWGVRGADATRIAQAARQHHNLASDGQVTRQDTAQSNRPCP